VASYLFTRKPKWKRELKFGEILLQQDGALIDCHRITETQKTSELQCFNGIIGIYKKAQAEKEV
jgi:hypothetical protein